MSIFWVEHDAPLSSSSFLSLSFHLTPSRLFCPLTLLSLSPSLFEGKQLCRSGAKEQATMSLPPRPPARARVFGREKTWSASTAAAIKRCCCRFSVSVCGIYADASSSRSSSSNRRRFGDLLHSISSHFFSPLSICLDVDNIHVTSRTPACADAL